MIVDKIICSVIQNETKQFKNKMNATQNPYEYQIETLHREAKDTLVSALKVHINIFNYYWFLNLNIESHSSIASLRTFIIYEHR